MSMASAKMAGTLIALLSAFSSGTEALTLTASSNLSPGTVFTDTVVSGAFDITPHLPAGSYLAPYVIAAGSILFEFADDAGDPQQTGSSFTSYSYGGFGYYSRIETRYFTDPAESVRLNAGPITLTGSTAYYAENTSGGTYYSDSIWHHSGYWYTYSYSCGFLNLFTCYGERWVDTSHYVSAYTTVRNATSGYGGDFSIGGALDADPISTLSQDGLLPFTLTFSGDSRLVSSSLSVEILENPPPIVPLPGAAWLLGSVVAVAGLAFRWPHGR